MRALCISTLILALLAIAAGADVFGTGTNQFSMEFVTIGNPGNKIDVSYKKYNDKGAGSVGYEYRIGKYEVTISQFEKACALDKDISDGDENPYDLPIDSPASRVSWLEAAKFCNWLTSGCHSNGTYRFSAPDARDAVRREAAIEKYGKAYVLPTVDEWHKAAYFCADSKGYTRYSTGNLIPVAEDVANYGGSQGDLNRPWAVGSGGVADHNGTFDMNGNVHEWNEDACYRSLNARVIRGGSFRRGEILLRSSSRERNSPSIENSDVGFRVAEISDLKIPTIPKKQVYSFSAPSDSLAIGPYDFQVVKLDVVESDNFQLVTTIWEEGFTNCFDIYWSTNKVDWQVAGYNICPLDFESNTIKWKALTRVQKAYFSVQNTGIDHDEDGIPDCREVFLFKTDPAKTDTDGDSIPDLHELKQRTDPVNEQDIWDTDLDGLPDEVEMGDIIIPDETRQYTYKQAKRKAAVRGGKIACITDYASVDEFKNSLFYEPRNEDGNFWVKVGSNRYAMIRGRTLEPIQPVSDKAGFLLKISNLNPESWDTDGDGISDAEELFIHESNPFRKDTDGDGISDYEEVKRGLHPVDSRNFPIRYGPSKFRPNPYHEKNKERQFKEQLEANKKILGIKPPENRPEREYDGKFRRAQILRTLDSYQKITYRVLDMETGLPVTNAAMRIWREDDIPVASNGCLEFMNKNPKMGRELNRSFSAPGYYLTRTKHVFEKTNWLTGHQLPWNPTKEVPLRKIGNPVGMVSFHSPRGMEVPVTNAPVEFDAVIGDWLPPHGKGQISDFVFFSSNNVPQDPLVRNSLSFSIPLDGIQEYRPDEKQEQSEFIFPYLALLDGYKFKLEKSETTGVNPRTHNFKEDVSYIFRIRSQRNKNGDVSALHGRINGELEMGARRMKFNYLLNTNRTSRSLEHNEPN